MANLRKVGELVYRLANNGDVAGAQLAVFQRRHHYLRDGTLGGNMRWNIIVECVGEDGKQSTITLGTVERLAESTTAENLGVNLQESKQIANRLQDTVVNQHANA